MKATFDLPDDLVQRIKLRAVRERKPLKRVVADLLTQSLDGPETPTGTADHTSPPEGVMLTEDGFPVIQCGPDAPASRMTVEDLLVLEQQALQQEDLSRAGLAH